jgi:hypothetical protein
LSGFLSPTNDRRTLQLSLDATPPAWEGTIGRWQQAAEKPLKDFLIRTRTDSAQTHDLEHAGHLAVRLLFAPRASVEPLAAHAC